MGGSVGGLKQGGKRSQGSDVIEVSSEPKEKVYRHVVKRTSSLMDFDAEGAKFCKRLYDAVRETLKHKPNDEEVRVAFELAEDGSQSVQQHNQCP